MIHVHYLFSRVPSDYTVMLGVQDAETLQQDILQGLVQVFTLSAIRKVSILGY